VGEWTLAATASESKTLAFEVGRRASAAFETHVVARHAAGRKRGHRRLVPPEKRTEKAPAAKAAPDG